MAKNTGMVKVDVGGYVFKVRETDLAAYLQRHEGAVVVAGDVTEQPTAGAGPVAIDDMTVAQLRALGAEWGATLPAKANRAQLITLLRAEDARRAMPAGEHDATDGDDNPTGDGDAGNGDQEPTGDGDAPNGDETPTGENAGDTGTQE